MDSRRTTSALALSAFALVLMLAGCSASDTPSMQSSPTGEAEPVLDSVALTFELDGTSHTVVGSVSGGLRTCGDGRFVTVATKEFPDVGVQLGLSDNSGRVNVAAWVVGEYAVQFLGDGDVEGADGNAGFRGSEVPGTATVRVVEAGTSPRLNELDMSGGERVEATATFWIDCSPR